MPGEDVVIHDTSLALPERNVFDTTTVTTNTILFTDQSPTRIIMRVEVIMPEAILVFGDTYYPGWVARVDNKPVQLYREYDALRAVAVERGKHTIVMTYDPASFRWGVVGTAIGLGAAVCFWWAFRKRAY